jgi:hypothetical protein
MKTFTHCALALAIAASLSYSLPSIAGNNDGSLRGQVTNAAEQSIAGARVTITNPSTGFSRTTTADEDGNYRFTVLPVGRRR